MIRRTLYTLWWPTGLGRGWTTTANKKQAGGSRGGGWRVVVFCRRFSMSPNWNLTNWRGTLSEAVYIRTCMRRIV